MLGTIWYRTRGTLRSRLGGYVSLALVVGILGAVAMAAMTAARRTDSSYPDYLASTNPSALIVQPDSQGQAGPQQYRSYQQFLGQLRRLPHVDGLVTADAFSVGALTSSGKLASVLFTQVQLVASRDGMFTRADRITILQGRRANPKSSTQVVATVRAARQLGLHVGSHLRVGVWSADNPRLMSFHRVVDLTVTGIGVVSTQVVQDDIDAARTGFLIGTPELDRQLAPCCVATSYVGLHLADGNRYDAAVAEEYEQLANTSPFYAHGGAELLQLMEIYVASQIESQAQRAIRPEAIALAVFAIIAGLAALVIGAQAISRQVRAMADDQAVLRALGADPAMVMGDSVIVGLAAVVTGAVLAAIGAVALSPFSLFGPVRQVDPARGIYLDWSVLALGTAATIVVLSGVALLIGFRQAPHRLAARQQIAAGRSAVVRAGMAAGLPASMVVGLRFALESGRGRTAVPAGSVIAGSVLAILVGTAALTFGASLANLIARPALYGWNFSYALYSTDGWGPFPTAAVIPVLRQDKLVGASTGVYFLTVQVDGQTVPAILSPVRAQVAPPVLSGHALDSPGQIVLGPATLAQLHKRVGDEVTVQLGPVIKDARLRIVGTAALPAIGDTLSIHPSLATGAVLPTSVVSAAALDEAGPESGPNAILVRLRPGVSPAAGLRSLQHIADRYDRVAHSPQIVARAGPSALELQANVLSAQRPAEIVNYKSMGAMPVILAAGLAAGAAAALGVTLIASVRRRSRDFALLKTLGFTRRQLAGAVAWQSTTVVAIGLIVGVPLGIAAGRLLWLAFARQLSAVPYAVVPAASLIVAALAALAVANVIAALPGRAAARTPVARVLRTE